MSYYHPAIYFLLSMMLVLPVTVSANEFECTIKNVLRLNETGNIIRHDWVANYQDRKFTVERETGRVLRTTALKQRLSNYNRKSIPHVVDYGDKNGSLQAITLFEEDGSYAALQIDNLSKGSNMPFFYRTNIGMILTGLCNNA